MASAIRATTNLIVREVMMSSSRIPSLNPARFWGIHWMVASPSVRFGGIRCMAADSGEKKVSARLSQVQQLLQEAEERAMSAGNEPAPKITLDHVSVSFARSGGPGGQNVNKVNTKEKNRINKDGEIVISSTKTRTQKGNIEDALAKLQAIIDAASYVPPPPSEEQKKKIAKLSIVSVYPVSAFVCFHVILFVYVEAAIGEQKRLQSKKALSQKKAIRRTRDSWD
ncbi:hypothetical protein Syun_012787 [Stephania yunnanensis]|uniref:Prokaryotic-type class I peptide chain release factors domain-containing protein n=1 Tax=Stephania yunnanensis TaxID=152371 RepID=A0AAP0K2F2_9MAGN